LALLPWANSSYLGQVPRSVRQLIWWFLEPEQLMGWPAFQSKAVAGCLATHLGTLMANHHGQSSRIAHGVICIPTFLFFVFNSSFIWRLVWFMKSTVYSSWSPRVRLWIPHLLAKPQWKPQILLYMFNTHLHVGAIRQPPWPVKLLICWFHKPEQFIGCTVSQPIALLLFCS
jgi:hypothetical protein